MKRIGTLNSLISQTISELGHTDKIVICDSGLPIPGHVRRIDLALKKGTPSFMETLMTVMEEMQIETYYIARETEPNNPDIHRQIQSVMSGIEQQTLSHEELKLLTHQAKAVIRTGECTPYANIILESGVIF
ncbi:D-ribose pyranase [Paenibacillus allorhizosphaerae]|uniref:D-ribose pyranase n=1 Tax=Paenibacillus allorhizosphaerae TaxID=2849866 RepID=A0ABM8VR27_9BACL|nr:D-ribose pyranase [Paenibacillus allorhizosphaerae]CAG7654872.1 D-ribose pyranase [Paenibacillus allorhizosphaerae]